MEYVFLVKDIVWGIVHDFSLTPVSGLEIWYQEAMNFLESFRWLFGKQDVFSKNERKRVRNEQSRREQ